MQYTWMQVGAFCTVSSTLLTLCSLLLAQKTKYRAFPFSNQCMNTGSLGGLWRFGSPTSMSPYILSTLPMMNRTQLSPLNKIWHPTHLQPRQGVCLPCFDADINAGRLGGGEGGLHGSCEALRGPWHLPILQASSKAIVPLICSRCHLLQHSRNPQACIPHASFCARVLTCTCALAP